MTPSTNQSGNAGDWESEAHKMVATKSAGTLAGIVAGIEGAQRATEFIEAELEIAEQEGREPRRDLVGALNRIRNDADEEDDQDVATDGGVAQWPRQDLQAERQATVEGHRFLARHQRRLGNYRAAQDHVAKAGQAQRDYNRQTAGCSRW